MNPQLTIDFVSRPQNNPESQRMLDKAVPRLNKQCLKLLDLFNQGKKLTVRDGFDYNIGDLRARVRDLREAGYEVKDNMIGAGFKEYFLG